MKQLKLLIIITLAIAFGACSNAPQEGTKIGNPTINVPDTQQAAEMQKFLTENSEWEAIVATGCGDDIYLAKFDTQALTVTIKALEQNATQTINYTVGADGSLVAENETYIIRGAQDEQHTVGLSIEIKGCESTVPFVLIYTPPTANIYISTPPSEEQGNIEDDNEEPTNKGSGDDSEDSGSSDVGTDSGTGILSGGTSVGGVVFLPKPTTREIVVEGRRIERQLPVQMIPASRYIEGMIKQPEPTQEQMAPDAPISQ